MGKNKFYIFSVFLLSCLIEVRGQIIENEIPFSYTAGLPHVTSYLEMPAFSMDGKENKNNTKELSFAQLFPTNISPENAGEWSNTSIGKVWRVGIHSKGAYSLYITLNPFYLNRKVNLFVYTINYNHLKGAITQKNNNKFNVISIAPVPGEYLIIEMNVPDSISDYGKLTVSKVFHDFSNAFGKELNIKKNAWLNSCMYNINCQDGEYWQTEKRAVCKIITNTELCTGTLVANTSGTDIPYLLTAQHCVRDSMEAAEAIFYFNFENSYCSFDEINEGQSLSGAELISTTNNQLDFSLLKLNSIPPASYRPYYSGWDLSGANLPGSVSIHHASGGVKQIAIDYDPLITENFGMNFDSLSTWKVQNWEIGFTENGSSGAPLFNTHHRLIGTLTGGESTCGNPVNDYYTKFNLSWAKYSDPKNQLKAWLDPKNTNEVYISGYDPYGFQIENCDTNWNILKGEKKELTTYFLNQNFTQFAEKFYSETALQLFGIFINAAKVYPGNSLSNINVKVWNGKEQPENEIYSKRIFLKDLKSNSVNFVGFDSVLKTSGIFFIGYSLNGFSESDSFSVYSAENRGMEGSSTMYVFDGIWRNVNSIPYSQISTSMGIGVVSCYGKITSPAIKGLKVFPNPCSNYNFIEPPAGYVIDEIECYDLSGNKCPIYWYCMDRNYRLKFNLKPGIYFLRILTKQRPFIARFIVLN